MIIAAVAASPAQIEGSGADETHALAFAVVPDRIHVDRKRIAADEEAVGDGVRYTPLAFFLLRGDEIDFEVYRLKNGMRHQAQDLAKCCKTYVGRPYDIQYELDDEKIYCSELVFKAYRDATGGGEVAAVQRFGDLNWAEFKDDIVHYHGSEDLPLDRLVVTPASLTHSQQVDKVFELRAAVSRHVRRPFAFLYSLFATAL